MPPLGARLVAFVKPEKPVVEMDDAESSEFAQHVWRTMCAALIAPDQKDDE